MATDKLWRADRGGQNFSPYGSEGRAGCRCGGIALAILWRTSAGFPQPPVEVGRKNRLSTALVESSCGFFRLFHGPSGAILLSGYGFLEYSTKYPTKLCVKLLLFHTVFHNLWKRWRSRARGTRKAVGTGGDKGGLFHRRQGTTKII